MIYLDSPSKSLVIKLDGVVTSSQAVVTSYYFDSIRNSTGKSDRGASKVATTNNTSNVTIVSAPTRPDVVRNIHTIMVNNRDTVARTVTITLLDGSTNPPQVSQAIESGSSLIYETNSGWQVLSPVTAPFIDTTELVKGSLDSTKRLRIEVDGITTGTTRVWTVADADIVVAGSSSALTSGRVVYTTTGGLLITSGNLTYDGTTLTSASAAVFNNTVSVAGTLTTSTLKVDNNSVLQFADAAHAVKWSLYNAGSNVLTLDSAAANTFSIAQSGAITFSNTVTGLGSVEAVFVTGGRSGTNDILTIAGAASGTGPNVTAQNSTSSAYRPLTINASQYTWTTSGSQRMVLQDAGSNGASFYLGAASGAITLSSVELGTAGLISAHNSAAVPATLQFGAGTTGGLFSKAVRNGANTFNDEYITIVTHQGGVRAGEMARFTPEGYLLIGTTTTGSALLQSSPAAFGVSSILAFRGNVNNAGSALGDRGISIENSNTGATTDGNIYSYHATSSGAGFWHFRAQSAASVVFGVRGDGAVTGGALTMTTGHFTGGVTLDSGLAVTGTTGAGISLTSSSDNFIGALVSNTSNTSGAYAYLQLKVAGSTAQDPYIQFTINGVTDWSLGPDNSDSDKFKLSKSTSIGTNDYLQIDTSGGTTLAGNLTVSGKIGNNAGYGISHGSAASIAIGGGGGSPNAASVVWGDGTGWALRFMTGTSSTSITHTFNDLGDFYATRAIGVTGPSGKFFVDGGGDTYIYESSANRLAVVAGGSDVFGATASAVTINGVPLVIADGTSGAGTLGIYFANDTDTGIYRSGANTFRVTAGGTDSLIVNNTSVWAAGSLGRSGTPGNVPYRYVAVLSLEIGSGSNGGSTTATTWTKYPLNTEVSDPDGIVSLSSSQFTLGAGTYDVEALVHIWSSDATLNNSKLRLRNVTDGTTTLIGTNYRTPAVTGENVVTSPYMRGSFTIAGSKTFELQYYTNGAKATSGLGMPITSGENEKYGEVIIRQLD